jgi:hypothetical protein
MTPPAEPRVALDPSAPALPGVDPSADAGGAGGPRPADPAGQLAATRRALTAARQEAARSRLRSARLRERVGAATHAAAAAREFVESHRLLWEQWHRAWAELAAPGAARLLRVCAYCGAAVLDRADPTAPGAWGPVPPWVRDRLRAGGLGVRPSHGACPSCAEARLGG